MVVAAERGGARREGLGCVVRMKGRTRVWSEDGDRERGSSEVV